MEIRKISKDGKVMQTKDGKDLEELRFTPGDEFIPLYDKVLEKVRTATVKGKEQKITNYTLKCKVRDDNKQVIKYRDTDELFVTLTPAQAESLKKKVAEGIELNQNVFVVYTYDSKEFGKQIGLGLKKSHKPAIDWEI